MAKKAARSRSKPGISLVIVESPTKARTIGRFLGDEFTIEASIGHVRDLPQGAKEVPEQFKGRPWAHLGVDVEHDFEPVYVIPRGKAKQVSKLRALLRQAKELYLATDEDREGEAISWHLCQVLDPKVPVHRLVFHEITQEAVRKALESPRQIDEHLVRAQEARRIIDRLFGYEVSPLLWRKVRPRLSAGRVQSVAVRLVVERERQRMGFVPAEYWDLTASLATAAGESFQAVMIAVGKRAVPSSRDFDPRTGALKNRNLLQLDRQKAQQLAERLAQSRWQVVGVEDKPYTTRPYPPFTTSTLQQEANRKLGFTARYTMQLAQSLYETGHITYMRTDSTSLASTAVEAARQLVCTQYGPEYLPPAPRSYATRVKNAQEAHEAIRPAGHPFDSPESLRGQLSPDELRLYELIWKRTVASQMADARGHRMTVTVEADDARFQATGKRIEFPGYLRAYVEGADDPEAELADRETLLPAVTQGEQLQLLELEPKSHTTQPPTRYSEASLIRAMEEMGIGRPSTYASIIDTILARKYVFKRANSVVPTWVAFAVTQLLESHLPDLVDYQFTAEMEEELDAISRGEMEHVAYLRSFYYGDGHPGLKQLLEAKTQEIDARHVNQVCLGAPKGPQGEGKPIYVRVGRFGPFLEQGKRRAGIPENMAPDELTVDKALELLDKAERGGTPLGMCPESGKPVFVKVGRFGPYVQRGAGENGQKPEHAALLKGMRLEDVDLDLALKLLALPKTLGSYPENGEAIVVSNGRFGPFLRCGSETRSLPSDLSPLDITLEQAVQLLAAPKKGGRRRRSEPLRTLGESPATAEKVRLMDGPYGLYVTDGQTNASLPQGTDPEQVTLDMAVQLLQEKAAKPGRRARRAKGRTTRAASTRRKNSPKQSPRRSTRKTSRKSASD